MNPDEPKRPIPIQSNLHTINLNDDKIYAEHLQRLYDLQHAERNKRREFIIDIHKLEHSHNRTTDEVNETLKELQDTQNTQRMMVVLLLLFCIGFAIIVVIGYHFGIRRQRTIYWKQRHFDYDE